MSNFMIDKAPERADPVRVLFGNMARSEDFRPVEELTRDELIDVVYALRDCLHENWERQRERDAAVVSDIDSVLRTLNPLTSGSRGV